MDQLLPLVRSSDAAAFHIVKPRILILSFSEIRSDPRVMRQVRLLEQNVDLTIAGFGAAPVASGSYVEIPKAKSGLAKKLLWSAWLLSSSFEKYVRRRPEVMYAAALLAEQKFDLVIANDIGAVPLALSLADGSPVLADAHEFSPREFDDQFLWRLLFGRYQDYLCREYLPRVAALTTVCQGIADAYRDSYGVPAVVIFNAPRFESREPSSVIPGRVRLVHHGAAIRSRHLEQMIDLMELLDNRFTLDLMLVGADKKYLKKLRARASKNARIRFIEPVRMEDIPSCLNAYDVGLYLLPPVNFNHEYALPNKLFEFVQARLAIAIGPSEEMVRVVKQHSLGLIAESFNPADLATELLALTDETLQQFKNATDAAANELSYESSSAVLCKLVASLLQDTK